jgi:cell wall assembly regulator SMI1
MANPFSAALRDFWHTMTSYDRHSTTSSPHRTGRHVPLSNSGMFTGVATASDSRADITSPYYDESGNYMSSPNPNTNTAYTPNANNGPYSPGLRSMAARNASQGDGFEVQSPGDVPMQSFQDGLPPAPPVSHSWRKIDAWAEEHYPELFDQLCEGATVNDLNDLEHQLDASLPQDVRESLMVHDGQERLGMPTGIIFGSMLMDCEEIVQEWETWRQVNNQYLAQAPPPKTSMPPRAFGGGSDEASSSRQAPPPSQNQDGEWRQTLLAKQDCVPPNAVRKAYAHAGWIPLVRDWGGNNLAVDLAPGPTGTWGQIVLFGRDYDTKYVVARSWADLIATVANDLSSGKWFVDEETNELKLREFKETRVEPAYFSILRWRMDQKHGRKAAARRSKAPSKSGSPIGSRSASPYASPAEPNGDVRGRSTQRLSQSSPLASPIRPNYNKPPPLGRVAEEMIPELSSAMIDPSTLVEVETPHITQEAKMAKVSTTARPEAESPMITQGEAPRENGKAPSPQLADDAMKTIEI